MQRDFPSIKYLLSRRYSTTILEVSLNSAYLSDDNLNFILARMHEIKKAFHFTSAVVMTYRSELHSKLLNDGEWRLEDSSKRKMGSLENKERWFGSQRPYVPQMG